MAARLVAEKSEALLSALLAAFHAGVGSSHMQAQMAVLGGMTPGRGTTASVPLDQALAELHEAAKPFLGRSNPSTADASPFLTPLVLMLVKCLRIVCRVSGHVMANPLRPLPPPVINMLRALSELASVAAQTPALQCVGFRLAQVSVARSTLAHRSVRFAETAAMRMRN